MVPSLHLLWSKEVQCFSEPTHCIFVIFHISEFDATQTEISLFDIFNIIDHTISKSFCVSVAWTWVNRGQTVCKSKAVRFCFSQWDSIISSEDDKLTFLKLFLFFYFSLLQLWGYFLHNKFLYSTFLQYFGNK